MIIPGDSTEKGKAKLLEWALKCISDCNVSRQRRVVNYENRMRWYLYGDEQGVADKNLIRNHIDTLSAFLFSGESASFGLDLDDEADPKDLIRAPSFERQINKIWRDIDLDNMFAEAVTRALTFESMFIKLAPRRNDISAYLVEPGAIGVLREDVPGLDRQEAFTHQYWMTLTELYRRLRGTPDIVKIIESVSRSSGPAQKPEAGPIRAYATAVPASDSGTLSGNIQTTDLQEEYLPQVQVPQTRITELWVKDDRMAVQVGGVTYEDYRLIQIADPNIVLYNGPGSFLYHEHPFIQIMPERLYSYFFGMSMITFLKKLQDWENDETWNVKNIMEQQFDPPRAFMGFDMMDEAQYALSQAGASVSSRNPQANVKDFRPPMPPDVWAVASGIDQAFADATGVQDLLQGKGGGKNAPHASLIASLGSARLKRMSGAVEDSLDQVATKLFKCVRGFWTDKFTALTQDGSKDEYLPSDFTADAVVHVDGHSQSPIFMHQSREDADALFKAKAINRARYIKMMKPADEAVILRELKDIESAEAQQAERQFALDVEKAKHRQR